MKCSGKNVHPSSILVLNTIAISKLEENISGDNYNR